MIATKSRRQSQVTDTILMVRPTKFRMNEETAVNNYFQENQAGDEKDINDRAKKEFDTFAKILKDHGINVLIVEDSNSSDTPDSIFPNNWISFHEDGTVVLYPMFAENRRKERQLDIWKVLNLSGFDSTKVKDYSNSEQFGQFLEGTGSMVLDREKRLAYCALSDKAHPDLLEKFCFDMGYTPISFSAFQDVGGQRKLIYHTNVMICIANRFVIICSECIDDDLERKNVIEHLKQSSKHIIHISEKQMSNFAGNMLQVRNNQGYEYLIMSSAAANSLLPHQIINIQKYCDIVHTDLSTIEICGGGSARCMMAEVFLPKRSGL
ncbi:amidinotransferase [Maribacter algarum]|uniref:Amidinotransferase n=1 Tax=Maribacter algarum (ex Zhang et al. 2020) TaxID=2578118 RepID=A0A5S3PMU9_9FLAO|nr:arginine deiminase-related protein [Maribacter algarum]TMM55794.1 amidinotransferase [Maribacter algarum]